MKLARRLRWRTSTRRPWAVVTITALILVVLWIPASAVKWGEPDGNAHPYVGLAVFDDASGNPMWRCSGTLLSPYLFLTAGHCTESAARATVWFEDEVRRNDPAFGYPFGGPTSVDGTPYTHPDYNPAAFFLYDLGVVVLDQPVYRSEYGVLPALGVLDALATARGRQNQLFTVVGYGLQQIISHVFVQEHLRRERGTVRLIDLRGTAGIPPGTSALFSNNPGKPATGGTCFGDSGGPIFMGDSNVVVAVTSFGLNGNCAGTGGGYRVDTADDLTWLTTQFAAYLP